MKNQDAYKLSKFVVSQKCNDLEFTVQGYLKKEKIRAKLEEFADHLEEVRKRFTKTSSEYDAYQEEKLLKMAPFVVCDKNGKPIITNNAATPIEDKLSELSAAMIPFNAEHQHLEDEQAKKNTQWKAFFTDDDADLDFDPLTDEDVKISEFNSGHVMEMLALLVPSKFE